MEPTRLSTAFDDSEFDDPHFDARYGAPGMPSSEDRTGALLAHLSAFAGCVVPFGHIGGPLVMWLVKKDQSPFVADQALEALNFQITMTIAFAVSLVLMFVLVGFVTTPILAVAWLVLVVVAAVKANEGQRYRYPFTLRLVK